MTWWWGQTGRKILRPGNPNFETKPEIVREPSTGLHLHLPTITQTNFASSLAPKNVHKRLTDAAVKLFLLSPRLQSEMVQGPGANEILPLSLRREDASASKTPRLGWAALLPPPGRASEGRAAVVVPVLDVAVLPNHRNRIYI